MPCSALKSKHTKSKIVISYHPNISLATLTKFSRDMRLSGPAQYGPLFKEGEHAGGGGLTVLYKQNTLGYPRLGLAIAKKHIKFATGRNKIKRIIRTSFREHQAALGNVDIVVLSRKDIAKRAPEQIWAALERHWGAVSRQWEES